MYGLRASHLQTNTHKKGIKDPASYNKHSVEHRVSNTPVIVRIIPVIKVHEEALAHDVRHRGDADERRIHAVHGFQL